MVAFLVEGDYTSLSATRRLCVRPSWSDARIPFPLRNTDGDHEADRTEYFVEGTGGADIGLHDGSLYFGPDTAIWRIMHVGTEEN
ncbi:MAG: hypothetical protein ABEL51_12660 [Salinibacter sp.]